PHPRGPPDVRAPPPAPPAPVAPAPAPAPIARQDRDDDVLGDRQQPPLHEHEPARQALGVGHVDQGRVVRPLQRERRGGGPPPGPGPPKAHPPPPPAPPP